MKFEWYIGEEEFVRLRAWADETASPDLVSAERQLIRRLLHMSVAVLVVVVAAGASSMSSRELEHIRAVEAIQHALTAERRAWYTRDRGLYDALIDSRIETRWIEEWRDRWGARGDGEHEFALRLLTVQPEAGLMRAQVTVTQPRVDWWRTHSHRENRYYRQTPSGWVRTLPAAEFWGEPRTLQSEHVHFTYYEPDTDAVAQLARQMDRAYPELQRILGLDLAGQEDKLTIAIVPEVSRTWSWRDGKLEVLSPRLAQVQEGLSDADYLASYTMRRFINRAFWANTTRLAGGYAHHWAFLLSAVQGWLHSNLLEVRHPWHVEAMDVFRSRGTDALPLSLASVTGIDSDGRPTREEILWHYMAGESVAAYVAHTYGQGKLADLLNGFVKYGTWSELIPGVFNISPEQFTADWNLYVTETYRLRD